MTQSIYLAVFGCAVLTALTATAGDDNPILAPGAKLQKLAGDFLFTEGPACDADGNVYFTDQPNDRIMIWSAEAKLSTFMQPCGRSNGLCFDNQGNLIACADEHNQLWSIDVKTKQHAILVKDYDSTAPTTCGSAPTTASILPTRITSASTGVAAPRSRTSRAFIFSPPTARRLSG